MTTHDHNPFAAPPGEAEIDARVQTARLELALLRHRARTTAIAAVRAGWWLHTVAHQTLTDAGLPGLPMLWPIHVRLPLRWAIIAVDAEQALAQARPPLTAAVEGCFGDVAAVGPVTIRSITNNEPDERSEQDEARYQVGVTVTLDLSVTAVREDQALAQARDLVTARLGSRSNLAPCGGGQYLLPEERGVWDLDIPPLDPELDGPGDSDLRHLVAHGGEATGSLYNLDRIIADLTWLRRALRSPVIDGIGDSIGYRAGDDGYHFADQILQAMGLEPLPRSWQYEITTQLPVTVDTANADDVLAASYRQVADISATAPQRLLPITVTDQLHHDHQVQELEPGRYRVVRTMAYLVCLRGPASQVLAEAAVHAQLATFDPDNTELALHTVVLGRRVDRLLDRDHD
ncbi:hypothetical protein ACLQ24_00180 [Micromonospora sp. DT4]|uniref:hypothetical protein n=1 Tax=Micromonospora sp. DT4 TaxID=3393438 RepID=UPI003CF84D18